MKVIATDNFDRDLVSDKLVQENLTREDANAEADRLNARGDSRSEYWYMAVADDYKLKCMLDYI